MQSQVGYFGQPIIEGSTPKMGADNKILQSNQPLQPGHVRHFKIPSTWRLLSDLCMTQRQKYGAHGRIFLSKQRPHSFVPHNIATEEFVKMSGHDAQVRDRLTGS